MNVLLCYELCNRSLKLQNADCTKTTTIHVDAFLYDDEAIDDLVDAGRLSRNYCKQCGSHQVAALSKSLFR